MSGVTLVVIDNYDSFTYNTVQLLGGLGANCYVVLNDRTSLAEIAGLSPHAIVLSPGPGTPDEAGITLEAIGHFAGQLPLLGVCLGHQAIGQYFGASIVRARRPVHGKPCAVEHDGRGVFRGIPSPARFGRYNSLVVDPASLSRELVVSALSDEGEVMGLRHEALGIESVQFHPESVLSECGKRLFLNWLEGLGEARLASARRPISGHSEPGGTAERLADAPRLAL